MYVQKTLFYVNIFNLKKNICVAGWHFPLSLLPRDAALAAVVKEVKSD